MKKILLIIAICFTPVFALALTGDAARFDFTNGQPTIVDDSSTACKNETNLRYDFTNGQPTAVYDSTANLLNEPCNFSFVSVTDVATVQAQGQIIINGQVNL